MSFPYDLYVTYSHRLYVLCQRGGLGIFWAFSVGVSGLSFKD